ncbi:Bro-N domain-containing protein [Ruminococcus sp.]|uniref:BRO-N domain-containing protein n=1 Tax=Ruminococcus sp. TaxID=41978 RepID=UPI003890966F
MNLELIKSAKFGDVQADIYKSGDEPYMTAEQLGSCLGYSHPRENVNKLVQRNPYLKGKGFSSEVKMTSESGAKKTRVFNEDGIYEVTMLAKTARAQEFRAWVRKLLKSLRRGDTKLVSMTEYQRLNMQTRAENAKIRKAQILNRLASQYEGTTYQQVLNSYATKELTGEHLLPLPQLPDKTYTATELGEMFGVSANRIGIITNRHNLKTSEYGAWFNDKAKGHNKEIQSFRYFPNIIPVLRELLKDIA